MQQQINLKTIKWNERRQRKTTYYIILSTGTVICSDRKQISGCFGGGVLGGTKGQEETGVTDKFTISIIWVHISELTKLYTVSTHSLLYINYITVKLF